MNTQGAHSFSKSSTLVEQNYTNQLFTIDIHTSFFENT